MRSAKKRLGGLSLGKGPSGDLIDAMKVVWEDPTSLETALYEICPPSEFKGLDFEELVRTLWDFYPLQVLRVVFMTYESKIGVEVWNTQTLLLNTKKKLIDEFCKMVVVLHNSKADVSIE
jgi:hypothetical protein